MILRSNYNDKTAQCLWLAGDNLKLNIKIAKLTPNWTGKQVSQVLFYDDYNRHISEAGQYLLQSNDQYLLTSDEQILVTAEHSTFSFAHDVQHPEMQSTLTNLVGLRKLQPILNVKLSQFGLHVRDEEQKCVARAHFAQTEQGTFVQLEAIRGYDKAARQLKKALLKKGFTDTSFLVSHHLFQALAVELPPVVAIEPPQINPQACLGDVVCDMCHYMLRVARSHEQGILNTPEDTEFLHDFRVSLRKTRSLLSLMKSVFPGAIHGQMKARLAELMRPTNLARDLDVYLLEQRAYEQMLPEHLRAGLPTMFDDFRRQHQATYAALHEVLKSRSYATEVESCMAFFDAMGAEQLGAAAREPVLSAINHLVRKKYRKIIHFGNIITPMSPDEEVHDLRLECKKFRYLLEFFGTLYPSKKLAHLVKNLKRMQNTLGLFNDFSVQQEALHQYLSKARPNKKLHMSVGALILVLAQKQMAQRQLVEIKFREFASDTTADLVQALFSGDKPNKNSKERGAV